jgi:hypothetical protein
VMGLIVGMHNELLLVTVQEHSILCRILGSCGGGYEEYCQLVYNAMKSVESQPTFWSQRVSLKYRLISADYMVFHPRRRNSSILFCLISLHVPHCLMNCC